MHIKDYLNLKVEQYNNPSFIEDDPIKIPHLFKKKEDIEISGFLTSSIAWGNRKSIISNSKKMMQLLDNDPYNVVINHSEKDLNKLLNFLTNKPFFSFLLKNLLPNIGDRVRATNEETTIEKDKAIAVSLKSVPEIPFIKIRGKNTATKINVVAIIANVICFDPLYAATKDVSPFSIRV